ncbi:MAG: isocitrate/isopropylmalate dehydrogenase family protein [Gemmatimonadetes bacterium]|nr:isocitrate/isopropylmalate dehydrogenase family protein [Gemmatimonadota bacterium]
MKNAFRVAVIGGDGIGPEVVDAAIPAIERAARIDGATIAWERMPYGADHFLRSGETLPDSAFQRLQNEVDAILVGALGDPRVPDQRHARDILLGLRFRLDLYINLRPCRLLHPDLCPLKGDRKIDLVIFRENTEGLYLARGRSSNVGTPEEEQIAEDVHTAPKVTRIIRAAFEWAKAHGKAHVTMADKSNAIPAHHIWQRIFAQVGEQFPGIERDHYYIDALVMQLVKRPEQFQVIVTNNLFGDIISDLSAQLVGGLGVAPSGNLHPGKVGLFEPVHGSAPKYAGQNTANPMATILTGAMLLRELGLAAGATRLEDGVGQALAAGIRTSDLGGKMGTAEVGKWIDDRIRGSN